LFELDGKVAVVTGALGQLGRIWTRTLLGAGASVAALDRAGAAPGPAWEAIVEEFGEKRVVTIVADVCDRGSLAGALDTTVAALGPPDVLVNNAGIDQPPARTSTTRLEDITSDAFSAVLAVNVVGAFQAIQVFGGAMVVEGRGSIVNIGSLYATVSPDARMYDHIAVDPPFLKPPAYGASKAALVNLTRYFATHWAAFGVRVNTLSPGGVAGKQDDAFIQKFSARVPMGRLAVDDDLVGPLLFLASDASAYVTGIDLRVDGGYAAW